LFPDSNPLLSSPFSSVIFSSFLATMAIRLPGYTNANSFAKKPIPTFIDVPKGQNQKFFGRTSRPKEYCEALGQNASFVCRSVYLVVSIFAQVCDILIKVLQNLRLIHIYILIMWFKVLTNNSSSFKK
jgi:hypothetical protein